MVHNAFNWIYDVCSELLRNSHVDLYNVRVWMSNARQKQRSPNNLLQFVRALNTRRVKISPGKNPKMAIIIICQALISK